jgi:hypothetical protein
MAAYSEKNTKFIGTVCGKIRELLNVNQVINTVTTVL